MKLQFHIENYKSIKKANIVLRPGLNILVGPNGSGKTCLLSSLKFIRDLFRLGAAQGLARQGGVQTAYYHGTEEMNFSLKGSYGTRTYRRQKIRTHFLWSIKIAQAGEESIATIIEEKIEITGRYKGEKVKLYSVDVSRANGGEAQIRNFLCKPHLFGRDLFTIWTSDYSDKNKPSLFEHFGAKSSKKEFQHILEEPDRSCFPVMMQLDRKIADIYSLFMYLNEYNISPDIARNSTEQLPFSQMLPNGAAVSEVIHALEKELYHKLERARSMEMEDMYDARSHFGYRRRYLFYNPYYYQFRGRRSKVDPLGEALENINKELASAVKPITSVSVKIDETNGKRYVVFNSDNDTFKPNEVSDGTVKWLCILVSLFVPFSTVYLLEEPENFLHPWMQQRLIMLMRQAAEKEKTIFFLSSHSATILNGSMPEEILVVSQSEEGTRISKLEDIESVRELLADSDFHLGDLWVSGAIGGVPSNEM